MQRPSAQHPEMAGPFPPDLHDVRHLRLKAGLLLLWALVSFGATYFARDLQPLVVAGWPLSYWVAAQGAVVVFIGIVVLFCWLLLVRAARILVPLMLSAMPLPRCLISPSCFVGGRSTCCGSCPGLAGHGAR